MRSAQTLIAAIIAGAVGVWGSVASAADNKPPPACAALTFRPVTPGLTDGEQDAGLYKSRFGKIALKAEVRNGAPLNYFVEVNGKPPTTLMGALPESVAICAKAKRLGAVGDRPPACLGDRFAVLVDHTGEQRYILLYAHDRDEWRFCSVGRT
jgi:hypothetical protein